MINHFHKHLSSKMCNHWIIRVKDGQNLLNSTYPIWGVKSAVKGHVKKLQKGDFLWFLTNKNCGGKFIAVAQYTEYFIRNAETLIQQKTFTNEDMNWTGDEDWCIQLHYINMQKLEQTEKNMDISISCPAVIMNYQKFRVQIPFDLEKYLGK